MTACGGILIGGEISRNEQCPHQADLRRLRLRIAQALAPLWIKVPFIYWESITAFPVFFFVLGAYTGLR